MKKRSKLFYHACQVQRLAFLRISELNSIKNFNDEKYTFEVVNSKGGKTRVVDFSITEELKERYEAFRYHYEEFIRRLRNSNWDRHMYEAYRDTIRQVCKATGESYKGSHMLRSTGIAEVFYSLISHGYTEDEAYDYVSHAMGHERREITKSYLG